MTPQQERNTARLREQRLARESAQQAAKAIEQHRRSAEGFWDNIDTSAGVDACHPWTGERKWNHTEAGGERIAGYFHGCFRYEGCVSWIMTRVLCFATYGREPPRDMDVMPLCGDHLCCNLKHLAVTPHGGHGANRLNRAVPVEEFFAMPCKDCATAPVFTCCAGDVAHAV